jgi:hypothetical protein
MDGLPAVCVAPNLGGGDITGDVFEQIDGGLLKLRHDLGRLLGFFFWFLPGYQVRWYDKA